MSSTNLKFRLTRGDVAFPFVALAAATLLAFALASPASAQRVFGVDTASVANSTAPSQAAWNNAFNDADGDGVAYKFAIVRALFGNSTSADTQFYTNISRATTAGMLAGSYHFVTPDTASGVVEANNYISKAGMYMKPGYLLPVFDLESGNGQSTAALTQWSLDYINTIKNAIGAYPIVYSSSSYANDEVTAAVAFAQSTRTPHSDPITYQWIARPGSASLATGQPQPALPTYPNPYGVWDPNFTTRAGSVDPVVKPWVFWQNGSGSPNGFLVDYNAANGNIEFVKDFLVPALWTNSASGEWGTIANWNSNNPGGGTASTGPASRLPNSLDWVKLQNTGGGTITLSNGDQNVRKFYTQQPLNITGGALIVHYVPGSGGKFDLPSEFKAAVTLSEGAYTARTSQVDADGGRFNINGGTVTFRNINLVSDATNPGKIVVGGNVTFATSFGGTTATALIQSTGSAAQAGSIDLGAAMRTITIDKGTPTIDLSITAPITGAGGINKAGAGTMQLSGANIFTGGTTVSSGILSLTGAAAKLGTGDISILASPAGTQIQIAAGVSNAIADTATLSLTGSQSVFGASSLVANQGSIDLGAGINETVNRLMLNGIAQGPGTYGSSSSAATFKNDSFFAGSGIVTVSIPEPTSAVFALIALTCLAISRRKK
jgi:autotransporter-associated beta strand protein